MKTRSHVADTAGESDPFDTNLNQLADSIVLGLCTLSEGLKQLPQSKGQLQSFFHRLLKEIGDALKKFPPQEEATRLRALAAEINRLL